MAPETWQDRARATALVLPEGSGYSHSTAASAHGLPLPHRHEAQDDLHVITASSLTHRRRPGWVGHSGAERRRFVTVDGMPVTDLVDTWIDLGAWAVGRRRTLSVDDLVVLGDEVVNRLIADDVVGAGRSRLGHPQRHLDPLVVDPVLAYLRGRLCDRIPRKLRGRTALEAALPLIRAGVRSPQETRTRLLFVRHGFPEPRVNVHLHARDGGGWLAEGDLVWEEERTVVEYQGGDHAQRSRRSADSSRITVLREEDWDVHEVWAEDLAPGARRDGLLQRVRASLERRPSW